MNERRKIEERLRKKEEEIEELEGRIREARIYSQALQDVLKLFPREPSYRVSPESTLRAGSAVALARQLILERNQPVHISEILESLGKEGTRGNRASLSGSLAAYVRRREVFTRPAPNTFGLVELGHDPHAQTESTDDELPEGFGRLPSDLDMNAGDAGQSDDRLEDSEESTNLNEYA